MSSSTQDSSAMNVAETAPAKYSLKKHALRSLLGVWGVTQVLSTFSNAIRRLAPVAYEPIQKNDMLPYQWGLYVAWSAYMIYVEGYKAFQKKTAPMVVSRAFSIADKPTVLNVVLAGPYSMGMFGASKKRMIIAWGIMAGVFSLTKLVKLLPYPYRSIVDAGVVLGLSYGSIAILVLTLKALLGGRVEWDEDQDKDKVKAQ